MLTTYPVVTFPTPRGNAALFNVRPQVNDDALVAGILGEDEYGLRTEIVSGWVIDIGAHIGIVAVAIALDNPDCQVVAVEAIPDNAEMVRRNVALNELSERVFVESAGASEPNAKTVTIRYDYRWAGREGGTAPIVSEDYVQACRYIGNIFQYPEDEMECTTEEVPALSLDAIIAKYKMPRVSLLKLDCEGCEYAFLRSKAIRKVDRIIGEFHQARERIHEMLDATHEVTIRIDRGGVGIFDAVLR
jgi:FkbM family methyltransferase